MCSKRMSKAELCDSMIHDEGPEVRLYDGMIEAVATWPEEMRDQILLYIMCLYAVAHKAAERDASKGHPLIKYISGALEKYGIKL